MNNLLPIMVFLPMAAAVVIVLLGSKRAELVRGLSLMATVATLVLGVIVASRYSVHRETENGPIQPQMEVRADWFSFGLSTGRMPVPPTNTGKMPVVHTGGTPVVPTETPVQPSAAAVEFYLGIDGISLAMVLLTAVLMIPSVLISWESITDRVAEYYALLLALETGMLGVFCSFDLFLFYVFFEFTLIPMFFLIGIWGGPDRRYAARKFFIYTLAGSLLGLVGLVALVLAGGGTDASSLTFSIPEMAWNAAEGIKLSPEIQAWVFLALFAAFAIKVPLFPFHTWLPLAHVEAPTAGSVLLAGVLLKLGTYGFLRLCLPLLPDACWSIGVPLIAGLSVVGIIYGALCALAQDDIKKLVAYSSVSHLGFCMLGMFALNAEGVAGSVLQMVNHGLSTGGLFLLVGMVYERYHTRKLSDLGGLAVRLPMLSCFMVFMCLSSVGLPGLNGFIGEVLCLIGMFKFEPIYAILGAVGIVLGAWYLFTMLQKAFFGPLKEPPQGEHHVRDLQPREWAALVPIAGLCLWIGVYPQPILDWIKPDVEAVVKPFEQLKVVENSERGT